MQRHTGFTLTESLTVLMITSILVMTGAPALESGIASMRARQVIQDAFHTIQHTRDLAINHQSGVITLCGSLDGTHCHQYWNMGWILFADNNNNHAWDEQETLYQQSHAELDGDLVWKGSAGRPYLRFTPEGYAMEFGSLTWCPDNGDSIYIRQVTLNRPGRARLSRDKNGDGIHEDTYGENLSCDNPV